MAKTKFTAEPGKQEIVMTRVFDAPPQKVFEALIRPELVARWWGGSLYETTIDKLDARPGGMWRFVQKDRQGNYHNFRGVFHEVAFPERIIQTFEYENLPEPGHVLLETIKLVDENGKTRMIDQSVFQSVGDRDAMLQAGMEKGANASLDALEALLVKGRK